MCICYIYILIYLLASVTTVITNRNRYSDTIKNYNILSIVCFKHCALDYWISAINIKYTIHDNILLYYKYAHMHTQTHTHTHSLTHECTKA